MNSINNLKNSLWNFIHAETKDPVPDALKKVVKEILPYSFAVPTPSNNSWEYWLKPAGYERISPFELHLEKLPGQVEAREECFFCPETALKVGLFRKGNELIVLFGALNSFKSEVAEDQVNSRLWSLIKAGSYNLFLGRPLIFERAHELVTLLRKDPRFKDNELVFIGQSYGGGLAAYNALKVEKCRGYCFNALPIGAWVRAEVGEENYKQARERITQVSINSDWLSDNILMRSRQCFESYLPDLPGIQVIVPSAYENPNETHGHVVGSLLKYAGFDVGSSPKDVMEKL